MTAVNKETIDEVREIIYEFFSDECDVAVEEITDDTNIVSDLEGDSLMLLSLLEIFRKKYNLSIQLKALGKHLMKRPAETVGDVVTLTLKIVEFGDTILEKDL